MVIALHITSCRRNPSELSANGKCDRAAVDERLMNGG
jgi:hypothetical protein